MPRSRRIRWGILGTGEIAQTYSKGVGASLTGEVVAVGSRQLASARAFADRNKIEKVFGSYEDLLADSAVEAVYIATPHPSHCEWTIKAARAGKHILCEKPIGMNTREAERMVAAAREADVLLMEAFMYRCHPQTTKVVELVRSGALGTVGSVQAAFSYNNSQADLTARHWSRELGGGGILDVGCYPVSFARLIAGAAAGRAFLDPTDLRAVGKLHPVTGIDVYTAAVMSFETGMMAQVSTGVGLFQDSSARIFGSRGWLHVVDPWLPSTSGTSRVILYRDGQAPEDVPIVADQPLYALEADAFARALLAGKRAVPEMSPADTLGNMRTLDRWRAQIGLTYSADN